MSTDQLQALTSLPIQGLLLLAVIALWRAYNAAQNARIDDLKKVIADINSRMIMVEDKLGIKPPLTTATFDKPDTP